MKKCAEGSWQKFFPISPARHLLELRLQEACRWLRESRLPVHQIARLVNIPDPAYFGAVFRKKFRQTAGELRKKYQS